MVQLEGHGQLDSNLLLFEKDEFVILHIVFGVSFQITPQLMQVEAVFVGATLSV